MFHNHYLSIATTAANLPMCKNHCQIMARAWLLRKLLWAFPCTAARFLLGCAVGATDVKGHIMGFAISACAPAAAQFHPASATAAKPAPLPKPPPQPAIAPVTPPASAEAIVMENARRQDPPAGIKFDDVPFTGDAAILVDDIIQPKPEPD